MEARPTSELLVNGIFWVVALALGFRLLAAAYFRSSQNAPLVRRRAARRERVPRWMASGITGLILVAGWILLAILTVRAAHRWRSQMVDPGSRKELPLDLHIPHVDPARTYTVIAKFYVRGRQYVSGPLPVKFGAQKPVYHLSLYYDSRHPERNTWSHLPNNDLAMQRAAVYASGWMFLTILLLEWRELAAWKHLPGRPDVRVA